MNCRPFPKRPKTLSVAIALSAIMLMTGCESMMSGTLKNTKVPVGSSPNGTYTVEMHPTLGSPKKYDGVLDGATTVSEAIADSGADRKFRGMDVEILRIVERDGRSRGLRMPIEYNPRTKSVAGHQDYALLDGDRVIVKPKEVGSLLKLISSMAGGPK